MPEGFRAIVLGTPLWKVVLVVVIGVAALLLTWLWGRLVHRLTRDAAAVRQLALRLTVPGLLALFA